MLNWFMTQWNALPPDLQTVVLILLKIAGIVIPLSLWLRGRLKPLAMMLLGVYDDLRGLKAAPKFLVQTAVAVTLYYAGFQITRLTNPFGRQHPVLGTDDLVADAKWISGDLLAVGIQKSLQ